MKNAKLYNLPFDKVQKLYVRRKYIEANNDLAGRTKLLRQYPELFDQTIWKEIEAVFNLVKKHFG